MNKRVLTVLKSRLAVCRMAPDAPVQVWRATGEFISFTRTKDELSIVCDEAIIPSGAKVEPGWRVLKVEGPLDFSLTGILAGLAGTLADAGVSLFAISTFDTDYILVRENRLLAAVASLKAAGYEVQE